MEIIFYIYIFIIGTLFGSFSSVIIYRLRNNKTGILIGKSECPKCKHKLNIIDLIPIFSFIFNRGKCRYCKAKISYFYPILEVVMGLLFLITTYFLIDINLILNGNLVEIYKLCFFLLFSFLTLIYVIYDILYLEIPDSILAILIFISFFTISIQSIFPGFQIINILSNSYIDFSFKEIVLVISSGIISILGFYFIMLKGLKEIYDIMLLCIIIFILILIKFYFGINFDQMPIGNATLGSVVIFIFLFLQVLLSGGTGMGGGDLRIGILMGLIVGFYFSFYSIIISYLFGSFIGIGLIIYTKIKSYYENRRFNIIKKIKKLIGLGKQEITLKTKIPFGPFLAIGIYIILFWGNNINNFIKNYL